MGSGQIFLPVQSNREDWETKNVLFQVEDNEE